VTKLADLMRAEDGKADHQTEKEDGQTEDLRGDFDAGSHAAKDSRFSGGGRDVRNAGLLFFSPARKIGNEQDPRDHLFILGDEDLCNDLGRNGGGSGLHDAEGGLRSQLGHSAGCFSGNASGPIGHKKVSSGSLLVGHSIHEHGRDYDVRLHGSDLGAWVCNGIADSLDPFGWNARSLEDDREVAFRFKD